MLGSCVNIYTKWAMKEDNKKYFRQLAEASTIGLQVAFSIFIGLGIGVWLDSRFGTFPWLTLLFLVFGIASGALSYYRFIMKQKKEDSKDNDR